MRAALVWLAALLVGGCAASGEVGEAAVPGKTLLTLAAETQLDKLVDPESARRLVAKVQLEDPDHAGAHSGRGGALVQLGREEEALVAYERATQLAPDVVEPFFERSKLHFQREEYSFAMQGLQMVLKRDPNNVEALYMKGQLMHMLGNFKGAFFSLQRANELAPDNKIIAALYEEVKKDVDDPDAKLNPHHQH